MDMRKNPDAVSALRYQQAGRSGRIGMAPKSMTLWGGMILAFAILLAAGGCTRVIVNPMVGSVSKALEKQSDLQLVLDGVPTLLLVLDGFIGDDPNNVRLLMHGARSYATYAQILEEQGEHQRADRLSNKAKGYGQQLLRLQPCLDPWPDTPDDLDSSLATCGSDDAAPLFWAAMAWGSWINEQEGAPLAMAELPWVVKIMQRVVELDESYYHGGAHLFLGIYYASKPSALGGRPDLSRSHFERALFLADRKFLLTQVWYANTYARMSLDRNLYEKLLNEVINQPLDLAPDLITANTLARIKARKLLEQVDEYF